jgi:hypothetical protein
MVGIKHVQLHAQSTWRSNKDPEREWLAIGKSENENTLRFGLLCCGLCSGSVFVGFCSLLLLYFNGQER